ncbi:hypothetical protein SKAU_G00340670 [Synaphobranchus kaupii]|uniref:Sushi domain-containing protein n=1 Tax=Synaphobranchus kaupii TaxID=118154 RepID=A0A9Q1IJE0_SYNKA|nr:hypothetical protein SKAU_G00340670 [Synaphobranchus kaupii]
MSNHVTESEDPQSHRCYTFCRKLLLLLIVFHVHPRSSSSDFTVDEQFCSDPGFPLHGHRTPGSGVFFEGAVARFSCAEGFQLQGPAKVMCTQLHSGSMVWKPNGKPLCLREACQLPHIADAEVQNQTYRPGDQLILSCHEGFQIRYPDTDIMQSVCQDDGSWDNLPTLSSYVNISETESSLPVGALVRYQCFPGYKLDGVELLECMYNLIWSDVPPRCTDVEVCPLPPMVEHGDYICHPQNCNKYIQGTVVEFYCNPGYALTSDYRYITCQHGHWYPDIHVSCNTSEPSWPSFPNSSMTTWKMVVLTAAIVLLALLLVIVARVFQVGCKLQCNPSFPRHHLQNPDDPNVLVVNGIPVLLPTYDEAVNRGSVPFNSDLPPAGPGDSLHSEEPGPPAYPGHEGVLQNGSSEICPSGQDPRGMSCDSSERIPYESPSCCSERLHRILPSYPGALQSMSVGNGARGSSMDTASTSPSVDIADEIPLVEEAENS